MAYNLIIKPKAEEDLAEAIEWYLNQNENLAGKLLDKIDESLEKIHENPEHYQKRYKEIRIIFIKKFPYGIYYTVETNLIFVHAILHTKQNPEIAENRI